MKRISLVVACSAIALSACGKTPLEIVKATYIDGARTTTVANGLGKRELCRSTHWDSFKDERGRSVVQYKCKITDGDDFLKEKRDDYLERTTTDAESSVVNAIRSRDNSLKFIEEDFPDSRRNIERLQKGIERIQALSKQGLTEREQISQRVYQIQEIERSLSERRREAQRNLQSSENAIVNAKNRVDPDALKREAFARHPFYKDAAEIFQWIVNEEGQAIIAYGEIQAKDSDGKEKTVMKYSQPDQVIRLASQAQESKILEYIRGIGLASFAGVIGR